MARKDKYTQAQRAQADKDRGGLRAKVQREHLEVKGAGLRNALEQCAAPRLGALEAAAAAHRAKPAHLQRRRALYASKKEEKEQGKKK